ncbi:aldehyde dehydrogenase family protein [Shigella flexneri]
MEEALELANDTQYGLGAGVSSRNSNVAYQWGAASRLGVEPTVITLTRHMQALGGYKQSGIGRETTR